MLVFIAVPGLAGIAFGMIGAFSDGHWGVGVVGTLFLTGGAMLLGDLTYENEIDRQRQIARQMALKKATIQCEVGQCPYALVTEEDSTRHWIHRDSLSHDASQNALGSRDRQSRNSGPLR